MDQTMHCKAAVTLWIDCIDQTYLTDKFSYCSASIFLFISYVPCESDAFKSRIRIVTADKLKH